MPDLFADLGLNIVGRNTAPLTATIVGAIEPSDLEALREEGSTQPQRIAKLRQRHHALAKALCDGIPDGEAGIICGYTASRVSILKSDPTFIELVNYYAQRKEDRYMELHDKIADLGEDVVDVMTERLEEAPDEISIGQLIEMGKLALDRSGHGPQSTTTHNVNEGLSARLAAARERAMSHRTNVLLEGTAKDITPKDADSDAG